MVRLGFIGTGKMAQALIGSILKNKVCEITSLIGSDADEETLKNVKHKYKICVSKDNKEVARRSDIIFLSVKPQNIESVLDEIRDDIGNQVIVSIAAGVQIRKLEGKIGKKKIIRVMPNINCLAGEMAAGFAANEMVKDKEIKSVKELLDSTGTVIKVKEELLDAVTALSGSGPAFVTKLIMAFTEAGVNEGLSEKTAYNLTLKTFEGTAKLLSDMGISPRELIDIVSSPGGTTLAGMEELDKSDVGLIIKKTIGAAARRSRELSG